MHRHTLKNNYVNKDAKPVLIHISFQSKIGKKEEKRI